MAGRLGHVVLVTTALCLSAAPVWAQVSGLSKGEAKCESTTGKVLAKLWSSQLRCVRKCIGAARKTGAFNGCFAPYADSATQTCINDPMKGAEAKARAAIIKKCADSPGRDNCPECYQPTSCTAGDPAVSDQESNIDPYPILIYCTEAGTTTPTQAVAKCEDGVAKALSKFVAAKTKCYDKCNQAMQKGTVLRGQCDPPPSDLPTAVCIAGAEQKAASSIDNVCAHAAANPGCYEAFLDTGAKWIDLVETSVDTSIHQSYCGSASGAFLD